MMVSTGGQHLYEGTHWKGRDTVKAILNGEPSGLSGLWQMPVEGIHIGEASQQVMSLIGEGEAGKK